MQIITCELVKEDGFTVLKKKLSEYYSDIDKITSPKDVDIIMRNVFELHKKGEEYAYMLALDSSGQLIGISELSHGCLNTCIMNPREILIRALYLCCVSIILVHNHSAMFPEPSRLDCAATKRINEACKLIGIELSDHVIIGANDFYSFNDHELLG